MSVHLSDAALLKRLIVLHGAIVIAPHRAFDRLADLIEIEGDILAAIRCPSHVSCVGVAEGILFSALKHIAGASLSQVEVYRYSLIAQHALPMVHDHLYAATLRSARARGA